VQDYGYNYIDDPIVLEMIDGKVYMMSRPNDRHLMLEGNIYNIFTNYFRKNKKKCVVIIERQLYLDDSTYVQPDLMVYCKNNNEKKNRKVPVIVVEILSDSTWKKDMTVKMKKYAELEIEEYWIIDPRSKRLSIYKLEGGKYELHDTYYNPSEDSFSVVPEIREKQQSELVREFSPPLFSDMTVSLEEVFSLEDLDII